MRFTVKRKSFIILLLFVVGGCVVGLYQFFTAQKIKNVIVISIDTCRAEFLSCYGFPMATTPNIDAIAREGLLCQRVVAPTPFTLPSHCSMHTGTLPLYHGVLDNGLFSLDEDNITLAEMLKERGFATGAFVSTFILNSDFGMDQGFDTYNDDFEEGRNTMGVHERQGGETTKLALSWMEENRDEKQFLFVHYYDPHFTYSPPAPFDTKFASASVFDGYDQKQANSFSSYAGEIAYVDHCIGKIIDKLKELGQYDSTLICITADHGEMLGQHGEFTHGYFIYEGNVSIPLVFKIPGQRKGLKIKDSTGLIDIVPTICSAIGIEIEHEIQGKDLLAYYSDDDPYPDRYLFCQSLEPTKYHANPLFGVVSGRYKYIYTTNSELYDLDDDDLEENNLAEKEHKRAMLMEGKLRQIIEDAQTGKETTAGKGVDSETLSKLESLGYVGSMVDSSFLVDPEKDDPKSLIDYHVLGGRVGYLGQIGEYEAAEQACREMIEQKPDLYMGYYKMAQYLVNREEYSEAIDYMVKMTELEPDFVEGYTGLAKVYQSLGQFDTAIKYALKALDIEEDYVTAYYYLSMCYYEKGMFDEPQKYLNKEISEHRNYVKVLRRLALMLYEKGQIKRSFEKYSELLELDPDSIYALNSLAWFMGVSTIEGVRNPKEAVRLALKACKVSEYAKAESIDTLAVAYAATGDFQKAIETAHKAIEVAHSTGEDDLAGRIQKRLDLYRQGKTYVDAGLKP